MDHETPFLRVAGVTKVFEAHGPGHAPIKVIDNVSMDLTAGEFAIYLGPSGCGKTTLLNIVAGLLPYREGRAMVDGVEINGPGQIAAWCSRSMRFCRGGQSPVTSAMA